MHPRSLGMTAMTAMTALAAIAIAACSSTEARHAPDGGVTIDTSPNTPADAAATDGGASPADGGDASTCNLHATIESAACTACLQNVCCAQTVACFDDPACKALDDCVNACLASSGGDAGSVSTCAQGCADRQPTATRTMWRAYNDCLTQRCTGNGAGPCQ